MKWIFESFWFWLVKEDFEGIKGFLKGIIFFILAYSVIFLIFIVISILSNWWGFNWML